MVEPTILDKHRTDDTVTFSGADGYILTGYGSATCIYVSKDNMGSWNREQPTCLGFYYYTRSINIFTVNINIIHEAVPELCIKIIHHQGTD